MKTFLFLTLLSSLAFGAASTTIQPQDYGVKQVLLTDQYGNAAVDQSGAIGTSSLQVSLGTTIAKSFIGANSSVATASTAYAEPLSYTTTTGKTFYITQAVIEGRLNTASATVSLMGTCSLQIPRGTTVAKFSMVNPSHGAAERIIMTPAEPFFATSGQITVLSCTPANATSTNWQGDLTGYEK